MLLEIGLLIKRKKTKNKKTKKQNKTKARKKNIKIALSLGYPSSYFHMICCSNGYIYHFLDYITLLLFVNANVIHHVEERGSLIIIIIIIIKYIF